MPFLNTYLIEVYQQAYFPSSNSQVCDQLSLVNRCQRVNGFRFDNNRVCDYQISLVHLP